MSSESRSGSRSFSRSRSSNTSSTTVTNTTSTTTASSSHAGEFVDHKVLSVVYSNGILGASYYTQEFLAVRMMPQLPDQGCVLQHLERLLLRLQPSTIIMSRTAHRDLANSVNVFVTSHSGKRVEKVPPQQMQLATVKQELLSLNLQGQPGAAFLDRTQEEKMIILNSILDSSQENSLRSLGPLLQYVKAHFQDLDNVVIASLGMHRGCGHLSVSSRTLRDLHVLFEETHPCSLQGDVRRSREGLSVFSLFERNCSIGRTRLKSLFAAPLNEAEKITESLNSVDYLVDQEEFSVTLQRALAKIKRIDRIVVNMGQGQTTVPEWQTLRDVTHDVLVTQDLLEAAPNASLCTAIERAQLSFSCKVTSEILHMVEKTIDFEAFRDNSSFTSPIRAGICSYLDEKKKQLFGNIHKKLTQLTLDELDSMPADVLDGRIVYLPCWGFVFGTTLANEKSVKRLRYAEPVCKMDTEVFFKTPTVRKLDREYGDLRNIIIHRENKICRTLQSEVLKRSCHILEIIDKLCDLDAVLALAITARDRGFTRPRITDRNIIVIRNGFHPLLGLSKPSEVVHIQPNSFVSSENASVGIVTGANSCGKSVYLRQNALIVFLAHVGSFVPAEDSKIGLLDTIQTSFFIDETMRDQASSFALQCRQVASIERSIESSRALVVIDEYGKGTNTAEGAGLCVGLLEKFMKLSSHPHVIFASHYYKHLYHFLKRCPEVYFLTFRYVIERDNFVQLHEVVNGISVRSFGSFAAREADLPPEIISLQERIVEGLENHRPISVSRSDYGRDLLNFAMQALEDAKATFDRI